MILNFWPRKRVGFGRAKRELLTARLPVDRRSMSKKNENEDRISLLPDCLLHDILSYLDTKQVVKTCVLSKRWKSVWTCIPTLNFDFNSITYPFKQSTSNPRLNFKLRVRSFNHFIMRVLSKHCGSRIVKLSYSAPHWSSSAKKCILEFFICYAACHMVQELRIDSNIKNVDFDWIQCVSSCRSLNVLEITWPYAAQWGDLMLPSLRILEIGNLYWDRLQNKMFSGCPNLSSLVVFDFIGDGCATICAPKLKNLELSSSEVPYLILTSLEIELLTPSIKCVKFENVLPIVKSTLDFPCLDEVNITGDFEVDLVRKHIQEVTGLLLAFHNARSITMPLVAIQVLLSLPPSVSEQISFHNLRDLKLEARTNNKTDLPIYMLKNLLKCPSLKTMSIDYRYD